MTDVLLTTARMYCNPNFEAGGGKPILTGAGLWELVSLFLSSSELVFPSTLQVSEAQAQDANTS